MSGGCSYSWTEIKTDGLVTSMERNKLSNAKRDKSNLEKRLKQMGASEKLADLQIKCAKDAATKYGKVVRNAIDKTITLEKSAEQLGMTMTGIHRTARHYLSGASVDAILDLQIGKVLTEVAEKDCYKIDLAEIAESAVAGVATNGIGNKLSNYFNSSKGGNWKAAIIGAVEGTVGNLVKQGFDIKKALSDKDKDLQQIKEMYNEAEAIRVKVRLEMLKMMKFETKKHEQKAQKEVKQAIKVKKEVHDIKAQIGNHSKTIGDLEALIERTLHPERYNGFVRKNGGRHPDQQFIYSREYRQHVYDNRTVYNTETYNRVCGSYDGDCGLGGSKSCSNAPSWMGSDFNGPSGGSSGGGKNGCSIM